MSAVLEGGEQNREGIAVGSREYVGQAGGWVARARKEIARAARLGSELGILLGGGGGGRGGAAMTVA